MDLNNKSLFRRHPLVIALVFLFFVVLPIVILALQWGGTSSFARRKPRNKVNSYRLPADFSFSLDSVGLEPAAVEAPDFGPGLAISPETELNERLIKAVSIAVAVIVGVLVGTLLSRVLV